MATKKASSSKTSSKSSTSSKPKTIKDPVTGNSYAKNSSGVYAKVSSGGSSGGASRTLQSSSKRTSDDINVGGVAHAYNSKGQLVPVLNASDRSPLKYGDKGTIMDSQMPTIGERRAAGELSDAQQRGTREINTNQPSPTGAAEQVNEAQQGMQGSVDYETAQANLAGGGLTGNTLAMAQQSLAGKYGKAFSALSGSAAPQQFGEALSAMSPYIQQDQNTMVADQALTTDPTLQMIAQATQQFLSPEDQKTSLMQEYSKLYKKSGIEKLDEEIIDAETIIDGTEDDIRNEVQMAGGMATDSQVQAMAIGRNKGLLKRYNQLVSMREQSQTRLDMMMNLTVQDRQMAMQKANMQLDAVYKFANFRMQVENNIKEGFNAIVSRVGYKGAYEAYSKDPRQLAMIERSMGLGAGGLAKLSQTPDVEMQIKQQQLYNEQLKSQGLRQSLSQEEETQQMSSQNQAMTEARVQEIQNLTQNISGVGTNAVFRWDPFTGFTGKQQNFIAGVEQLRGDLTLDSLINAKSRGATFGALSDGEMRILSAAASKIGTWAQTDPKTGAVTGYNTSPESFKKELDKINSFTKLDYIKKGGMPENVGAQIIGNNVYMVNSDGSVTEFAL